MAMFAELQETPSSVRYPWGSKMKDVLWDTTVGHCSEEPGRNGYWKVLVGYLLDTCFLGYFFGMTRNDLTFCGTWKPTVKSEAMSVAIDSLSAALLWTANETGRAVPKVASLVMNSRHLCKYGAFNVSFVAKMCRLGASSKKLPGEFCQRFPTSSTWNASHVRDHGDSSLKHFRGFFAKLCGGSGVEIDFGSLRGGFVWKWATKSLLRNGGKTCLLLKKSSRRPGWYQPFGYGRASAAGTLGSPDAKWNGGAVCIAPALRWWGKRMAAERCLQLCLKEIYKNIYIAM